MIGYTQDLGALITSGSGAGVIAGGIVVAAVIFAAVKLIQLIGELILALIQLIKMIIAIVVVVVVVYIVFVGVQVARIGDVTVSAPAASSPAGFDP